MIEKVISINIVLTCFNRREKTELCLKTLLKQNNIENYRLRFFVCDDGSTDGTADTILKSVPEATIVFGTGNLFWAKGMAYALQEAKKKTCDFYLMINDDVVFANDMLDIMFGTYKQANSTEVAISGAVQDPDTGEYAYGGEVVISKGIKEKTESVKPEKGCLRTCDRANWNCFLISSDYYKKIGNIDNYYEHSYADYDYSNRIVQNGGKIYISTEYVGFCKRNDKKNTWMDKELPMLVRLKKLHCANGIPFKSAVHYWRKFDRKYWMLRVARPYLAIFRDSIDYKLRRKR